MEFAEPGRAADRQGRYHLASERTRKGDRRSIQRSDMAILVQVVPPLPGRSEARARASGVATGIHAHTATGRGGRQRHMKRGMVGLQQNTEIARIVCDANMREFLLNARNERKSGYSS